MRKFLAGFAIGPGCDGDRLVRQLSPGAFALWHAQFDDDLAACALNHAERTFEAWLAAVLGSEAVAGEEVLPVGRAAFLACDGPARWGGLLLVDGPWPDEFVAAMRGAAPTLAPLPTPGTMAAQSLEAWTLADARRAVAAALDVNAVWLGQARPLITVPIKLDRWTS